MTTAKPSFPRLWPHRAALILALAVGLAAWSGGTGAHAAELRGLRVEDVAGGAVVRLSLSGPTARRVIVAPDGLIVTIILPETTPPTTPLPPSVGPFAAILVDPVASGGISLRLLPRRPLRLAASPPPETGGEMAVAFDWAPVAPPRPAKPEPAAAPKPEPKPEPMAAPQSAPTPPKPRPLASVAPTPTLDPPVFAAVPAPSRLALAPSAPKTVPKAPPASEAAIAPPPAQPAPPASPPVSMPPPAPAVGAPTPLNPKASRPPPPIAPSARPPAGFASTDPLVKAGLLGDAGAMVELGTLCLSGGSPDPEAARAWFAAAAARGSTVALYNLGELARRGVGGPVDEAGAVLYYTRAADANIAQARYRLALMLLEGRGTPQDVGRAQGLLEAAALQGHTASRRLLDDLRSGMADATARDAAKALATPDPAR